MLRRSQGCEGCGGLLDRKHRMWWQRLFVRSLYKCRECGMLHARLRSFLDWGLSTRCHCPRCGQARLKVKSSRDKIEGYDRSLFRQFQGLMGARLYYCQPCRWQFYDMRPRVREESESVPAVR